MAVTGSGETELPFRLTGWSAWTPECGTETDWLAWAGVEEIPPGVPRSAAADDLLPRALRRRTNPVGRSALAAATALGHVEDARYIVSTRHGEFGRMVAILESLSAHETPSPAEFSPNVYSHPSELASKEPAPMPLERTFADCST